MAYSLFLQYATTGQIYLDGAGITAPVSGARYSPGRGPVSQIAGHEAITEQIQIDLVGTYRQITDWISTINAQLEIFKAGHWHTSPNGPLLLCFKEPDEAGAYFWFSRVFDARLELDPNGLAQRKVGQQIVNLFLTREHRWESSNTKTNLVINLPAGGTQATYGFLLNHKDAGAGHTNWGWINPAALGGDLLSRVSLQTYCGAADAIGDYYIGIGYSDVPSPNVVNALPTLEETAFTAGAGVAKASVGDANSSGANYATFTWAAVTETLLATAAIPQNLVAMYHAHERPFKPMARLASAWAVTDAWFKAKILLGGTTTVLYETEWFLYPGSTQILEFPPVYLPPAGIEETLQLDLAIYGRKATAGNYVLPLDYVQLWPVDGGFKKYKQLNYFAGQGQMIDDGEFGSVYWANLAATQRRASVLAYGPPLMLLPGRTILVAIANITGGTSWLIDDNIGVILNQVPTKRNI